MRGYTEKSKYPLKLNTLSEKLKLAMPDIKHNYCLEPILVNRFIIFISVVPQANRSQVLIQMNQNVLDNAQREYIEIKDAITRMDKFVSLPSCIVISFLIYSIMSNIYLMTIMVNVESLTDMKNDILYTTVSVSTGIVITSFIGGLVYEKSAEIGEILSRIETKLLSDTEYKDWQSFHTVCHKTSFGFTIGGFASVRKSTLIPVNITS